MRLRLLSAGLERVRESCRETLVALHAEAVLSEASDSDEVMAYLQKHIQTLSSLQVARSFIASQQKAFGLPETKDEELKSALREVRPLPKDLDASSLPPPFPLLPFVENWVASPREKDLGKGDLI